VRKEWFARLTTLPLELFVAAVLLWVALGAYLVSSLDAGAASVGAALVALIAVAGLARPVRWAAAWAALLAIGVYAVLIVLRETGQASLTAGPSRLPLIGLGLVVFAITAVLVQLAADRIAWLHRTLRRNAYLIEELTIRDPVTGVIKRRFADQMLADEIQRSRRFARTLTLAVVAVEGADKYVADHGKEEFDEMLEQVGHHLTTTLRTIDKVSRHGDAEFALLLPETDLDGAQIITERIVAALAESPGVVTRVGLAEFPKDAAAADDLLREAHQALAFARSVDLKVASRYLLEGALKSA
jgi:diguanylate cyclase (GGDEF)-like protein